jgi:hypothetical protein
MSHAAGAQQRSPGRDSAAVIALEHEWLNGLHDAAVLNRVLASDFRHVTGGQVITKAQHIEWAVSHPASAGQSARFGRLDVRLFDNTAIADGTVLSTDRSGHPVGQSAFTDVFVYRNDRWRAVHAQETALPLPTPGTGKPTT